jgi:carboxyl-terminal processing protease
VTIAKYLTPNGRDINKHGIDPDVVVDLTDQQRQALVRDRSKIGTLEDPQFAKGLQVLNERISGKEAPRADSK